MITPDHFLSTDGEETWDWQNIPGVHVGDRTYRGIK